MGRSEGKTADERLPIGSPGPQLEQGAIAAVWKTHEAEIRELRRMRNYVMDFTTPWKGRPIQKSELYALTADEIIAMELSRALTSAWACGDLIASGYPDQALMVCRSMFEGMIVANWVNQNPEVAPERFLEAGALNDHLEMEMAIANGWVAEADVADRLLSADELERLRGKYGRYGEKMWTDPSDLRRLSDNISKDWEEDRRETLARFRSAALRTHNQTLHATPESLLSKVNEMGEKGVALSVGPAHKTGPGMVGPSMALQSAWWTLAEMARLVTAHFEVENDEELGALVLEGAFVYLTVYDDESKEVGRNDPCPCGSTRKFKRCHQGRTKPRVGPMPR